MSAAVGPRGRVSAKHALLGLLRERPAYGYQLGERLQERLGPAWAINSGHLYQTLKRMEQEGLNIDLDTKTASQILDWIGVDLPGRLVTQVSRFDPWKDPLGVIDAYRLVREEIGDLQLALVGSMALDDPEGWDVYHQVSEAANHDSLIHLCTNLTGVSNVEVNAFQRLSEVVVQKSIREGFGLVVSESLWKGTPVVAGRAGGIPLQMPEGVGGALIGSTEECAQAMLKLLGDRELASQLGQSGHEHVREHFLLPRLLMEELRLLSTLDSHGTNMSAGPRT